MTRQELYRGSFGSLKFLGEAAKMAKLIFSMTEEDAERIRANHPEVKLEPVVKLANLTKRQESQLARGLRKGSMTDPRLTKDERRRLGLSDEEYKRMRKLS